jgi:hypothetical protein
MSRSLRIGMLLPLISLAGCAFKMRLYPLCFYSYSPTKQVVASEIVPALSEALKMHISLWPGRQIVATPDGRWFVMRADRFENDRISKTWPRLACIGDSTAGIQNEKWCISYVRDFIRSGNYLATGVYRIGNLPNESPDSSSLVTCNSIAAQPGTN